MAENSNDKAKIRKAQKDPDTPDPLIGVEYGTSPVLPGARWEEWVGGGGGVGGTIVNRPTVTIDQITDMRRRDGQAKALIQLVMLPLRKALQSGTFVEPDSGDATPETDFLNTMWTLPPQAGGMSVSKNRAISQMLLAVTDGFAAMEIVRQIPKDGVLKGKITLRKLAYRDPRTLKIKVDDNGGYNGFQQVTQGTDGRIIDVTLKPGKTLLITQNGELNPYYGVSLFESAYPHFDAKRKLYYIAHLAAQYSAVPGRIGKIPHGAKATETQAFRAALQNFAFNASMVVPPDYEVAPFTGNSQFDFLKLIDHHNTQMSKSILAGFFDNDQRTVLIENTTQDASADLFLSNIETIANDIAEAISTYLIPQFIDYNFDSKKYPVFKPGPLSDSDKATVVDLFKTVVVAGILNSTPELVRELEKKVSGDLGLDIDYDEIAKKEKEAAQQKAKLEAEQAQMQADQQALGQGGGGTPDQGSTGVPGDQQASNQPNTPGAGSQVAASNTTSEARSFVRDSGAVAGIDDLVLAAQRLFLTDEQSPIDEGF